MERTQSFFLKESNSNDKIRIFCFPYAGGGASAYRNWGTYLPDYVGVYPIQIPGRENRITEKALTDMCELTKYEKFDFPITALYGDQDQDSEIDTVEAWSEYTNTSFNKKVFDLSVYDIFGAFNAGAALVLPDPEKQKDPYYWVETIKKNEITVWNSVPAQMQMLVSVLESRGVSGDFPLKVVLLSGDWIPVTLPDQIHTSCKKARPNSCRSIASR